MASSLLETGEVQRCWCRCWCRGAYSPRHHNYYLHKLAIYTTGQFDAQLATAEPTNFKLRPKEEEKVVARGPLIHYDESDEEKGEEEDAADEEKVVEEKESRGGVFPSLVGLVPAAVAAKPVLVEEEERGEEKSEGRRREEEEDERELKKREEEERKRQEETTKLRDKLAAKAREKMVQVSAVTVFVLNSCKYLLSRLPRRRRCSWRGRGRRPPSWRPWQRRGPRSGEATSHKTN